MINSTYQILDHGFEHAQYFTGCGACGTKYNHCVTGFGSTQKEAFNDALEQIATNSQADLADLIEKEEKDVYFKETEHPEAVAEDNEIYYYLSIRY